jgi:translation initiation factor 1
MSGRREQDDLPEGLTHNPFAALRPGGAAPAPEPQEPTGSSSKPDRKQPGKPSSKRPSKKPPKKPATGEGSGLRLVARREKRGRGGKTVTRIAGLDLGPKELDALARELKRALGCGASVEDGDVVLQGALVERAAVWLEGHLSARVTRGN